MCMSTQIRAGARAPRSSPPARSRWRAIGSPNTPASIICARFASCCTAASHCLRARQGSPRSRGPCVRSSNLNARSTSASTRTVSGSTPSSARCSAPSGSRSACHLTEIRPPTTCTACSRTAAVASSRSSRRSTCYAPIVTGRSTRGCCARSTCAATRSPSTARLPPWTRRTLTSCCRTRPGTPRRPAAPAPQSAPRTPTGWPPSTTPGPPTASGSGYACSTRSPRPRSAA